MEITPAPSNGTLEQRDYWGGSGEFKGSFFIV